MVNILSAQQSAQEQEQISIPVDYYRILGVPIQATPEQIEQAHRDRSLQMPRAEYSQEATEGRQQLVTKVYQLLSNPQERQNYDAQFQQFPPSATGVNSKARIPELRISVTELVGALVILQELGEYELVLKLGQSYQELGLGPVARQDLLLSQALANLGLGREQWHQGKYEKAAFFLLQGEQLLSLENIAVNIQDEIRLDLAKLRPYRILELLSLNLSQVKLRQQGLDLLQTMLEQRQGIEGKGDDRSGLNIDDFLRFIQQIQTYMTVAEQQELFEKEARRPSSVGTYLAFYALLARGFAEKKPELIFHSKTFLKRLLKHQDIYLEQAVCNLLLGQTDVALQALERSQETQTLDFIKEQSENAPDLLPGLCLYSERWLQLEVFPHFRDLLKCSASLKAYFDNQDVQNYLDNLPTEKELTSSDTVDKSVIIQATDVLSAREQLFNASSLHNLNPQIIEPKTSANLSMSEATRAPEANREFLLSKLVLNMSKANAYWWKVILAIAIALGFLTIISTLGKRQLNPKSELLLTLDQPLVTIPSLVVESTPPSTTPSLLNSKRAREVIEKWLEAKSRAYGTDHEIEVLSEILTGSLLQEKQKVAETVKNEGSYREYDHNLELKSIALNRNDPQRASIVAQVQETANYYQNGRLLSEQSYSSNLRINYGLKLVEGEWLIDSIKVIE
ncbi:IMS domain-containing protein [Gloeocapsa sp. PCC 73106]|uniref:IMS domain-containing protein n=1 Tax=Gloeocapsa sp. PCC 73106 TaxID=102232 RepID=UPI0002ACDBFB|nr:IMS domain-containing protein [Gloeocapsa sp. PCC 73106]ELR96504.1 DnaJ-class molecular chaperone with C-terminal Zn finger domain [Gloeocapsa sp. PCC 73106]